MYKFEHMTMGQIGQLFGATSHQVGRWLVEIGLRTNDKRPSSEAFHGNYVTQGPSRGTGYNWCWHSQKTVAALQKAGHRRIPNPPLLLVDPPKLNGPFAERVNECNSIDIINGDGSVAIVVSGEANADFLVKVLNAAHKSGCLDRHLRMPEVGPSPDHLAT